MSAAAGPRRGAGDGDAGVGLLQGRGVVDPVAHHAHDVAALLQHIDDVILMLGVDLGEAVDPLDRVVQFRGLVMLGLVEIATALQTLQRDTPDFFSLSRRLS